MLDVDVRLAAIVRPRENLIVPLSPAFPRQWWAGEAPAACTCGAFYQQGRAVQREAAPVVRASYSYLCLDTGYCEESGLAQSCG